MEISENLFHYFTSVGIPMHYEPGEIIYMQEDNSHQLYLIIKGRVRVFLISKDGHEITFDIIGKGKFFGESSCLQNTNRPVCVSAIDATDLVSCQLETLYPSILESKELTLSIMQLLSSTNDHLTHLVKKAYFYDRNEKISSFLLEQKETTITFTHEEIALLTGLSRVTVTKILNDFANSKLIKQAYRKIVILDHEGLKNCINK